MFLFHSLQNEGGLFLLWSLVDWKTKKAAFVLEHTHNRTMNGILINGSIYKNENEQEEPNLQKHMMIVSRKAANYSNMGKDNEIWL